MAQVSKGRWVNRIGVYSFASLLGLLVFWLIGFILQDVASTQFPDYVRIENQTISAELRQTVDQYQEALNQHNAQISHLKENQQYIKSNADNLKITIDQMLDLQKASVQKNIPFSKSNQDTLSQSQTVFLQNQSQFQTLNTKLLEWEQSKYDLSQKLKHAHDKLSSQRKRANEQYAEQLKHYRLQQAIWQVSSLIILLLVSLMVYRKYWQSPYASIAKAVAAAIAIKTVLTVHQFFPMRYFKYILISVLLGLVAYLLVRLIQTIKSPKLDVLLKQYREAYERFFCPKCDYPIQMGPRKYLFWTRRTAGQLTVSESVKSKKCCKFSFSKTSFKSSLML